jgi:hypothetical protein
MPTRGFTHPGTRRATHYDPTLSTDYASNLWVDCPLLEYIHDPLIGTLLDERFQEYDAEATNGEWVGTQATAGTAAISAVDIGTLVIDSNSSTDTQGFQVQRVKSLFLPAAGKDIWMEWQCKIADTPDFCQFFGGLSEVDTSIIASSLNSSANHIGFETVSEDGVIVGVGEKAGARGTVAALHTAVDDTWVKFGFKVTGVTSIQFYVNGVATGAALATANVPIVAMYPSFVCQTAGTNDPILHVRGLRAFQLR